MEKAGSQVHKGHKGHKGRKTLKTSTARQQQ